MMRRLLLLAGLLGLALPALGAPVGPVPYSALPNCGDTSGNHLNYNATTGAFTCGTTSSTAGANPTASIGMSAVNGSAVTFLRSDGAPAIGANAVTNAGLAQAAANTVKGNPTGSTANVTDASVPSCSAAASILQWLSGTGFQCGTTSNTQTFTSSGTWTKPYTTGTVDVYVMSQGGCAGGGAMEGFGTVATGGGGGGGGMWVWHQYLASDLANTTITIGTACTGGLGATVNGDGNPGSGTGASATFAATGFSLVAYGGGSGSQGRNNVATNGGGGAGVGGAGGNATTAAVGAGGASVGGFGGGGAGGQQAIGSSSPNAVAGQLFALGGGGGGSSQTAGFNGGGAGQCPGGGSGGVLLAASGSIGGAGGLSISGSPTAAAGGATGATGSQGTAAALLGSSIYGGMGAAGGGAGTGGPGGAGGSTAGVPCVGGAGGAGGTTKGGDGSAGGFAQIIAIARP